MPADANMKKISLNCALALTLFAMLFTGLLNAQNSRGSLRGTVQDATGARVSSAKIVAQLSGSSVQREATSEDRGEFRIDDLLPGNYRITVNAAGFAQAQADVVIAVASVRDITVAMKPSPVQQAVNVRAEASSITSQPVDLASVVYQGVVSRQDLETLPLAARSFANIAYLVPGPNRSSPPIPRRRASPRSARAEARA